MDSRSLSNRKVLLIVDVPRNRVAEVHALMGRTHPEANARGIEPAHPAFS